MLGAFSIAVEALPTTPGGFIKESEHVIWGATINARVDNMNTFALSGMYARPTSEYHTFGQTTDFEFLAFNWEENASPLAPSATLPMWGSAATVTYEVIPEPASSLLGLISGAAFLIALRRRKG